MLVSNGTIVDTRDKMHSLGIRARKNNLFGGDFAIEYHLPTMPENEFVRVTLDTELDFLLYIESNIKGGNENAKSFRLSREIVILALRS